MRMLVLVVAVALVVSLCAITSPSQGKPQGQTAVTCVLFDGKDNRSFYTRGITERQYEKWFKNGYSVASERIETPKGAAAFGALVVSGGGHLLVMPFYKWGPPGARYFACQSKGIGCPPRFRVLATSEGAFLRSMKRDIRDISTDAGR